MTAVNHAALDPKLWLRRFRPAEDAPRRLVCVPHAGGSASFYRPMALVHGAGADAADVVVLQYPGRQDRLREPGITDIDAYADLIASVLATQPAKPTVYFGHSMGAAICYEVALRLAGADAAPSALVVSGRRAPGTSRVERVHLRDDDGLLAEVRKLDGTESGVLDNIELLRMALPSIRTDFTAIETYPARPGRPVDCPITALLGTDDPKCTVAEAERWREHTTDAFRLRVLPGGHFYLTSAEAEVNEEIKRELRALPA